LSISLTANLRVIRLPGGGGNTKAAGILGVERWLLKKAIVSSSIRSHAVGVSLGRLLVRNSQPAASVEVDEGAERR
jgi:hypothetical protein